MGGMFMDSAVLHPFSVHFPVALWSLGGLLYILSWSERFEWLRMTAMVMGVFGSVGGYFAQQTGLELVRTGGYQGAVLNAHLHQAQTALIFFSFAFGLAAVVHVVKDRYFPGRPMPRFFHAGVGLAIVLGLGFLFFSAQNGYRLSFGEMRSARRLAPVGPVGDAEALAR